MTRPNIPEKQTGIVKTVQTSEWFAWAYPKYIKEITMWSKPEVTEMRFGFEVTMYVCNR